MTQTTEKALLPAGLQDLLPPEAQHEAKVVGNLLKTFRAWGYQHVKPPMLEFEDALLSGPSAAVASQTFRLMDPVSQRMMGLRADMTPQVARIAGSRLKNDERPLRLSYAGQVLQVRGSQLRPERQFGQVGVELLGASAASADAEVVVLGTEALQAAGVELITVDLNMPPLISRVTRALGMEPERANALSMALDGKDVARVKEIAGENGELFVSLLETAGPADEALGKLAGLDLPDGAGEELLRVREVIVLIRKSLPELALTLDVTEHRGFEYHSGIGFIFLARNVRGELGRGGRYATARGESSTGFSLYTDTLLRALPGPAGEDRLLLSCDVPYAKAKALREDGWITLSALVEDENWEEEAKRLGCTHWLEGDKIKPLR
ncbi:MAG: ATP phosphoribosyltransferase regulatory subunit [Kiloniellales bacterium]|nr:ATP phosphoribosyltransferase regulatory subunit [Kiloniellales bacterium]